MLRWRSRTPTHERRWPSRSTPPCRRYGWSRCWKSFGCNAACRCGSSLIMERTSKALDQWASKNNVTLHFSTPGKPMENGCIEGSHGKLREEFLCEHWLFTLDFAQPRRWLRVESAVKLKPEDPHLLGLSEAYSSRRHSRKRTVGQYRLAPVGDEVLLPGDRKLDPQVISSRIVDAG